MTETIRDDYDPLIVAAANRQIVRLTNGLTGRLIYWSKSADSATVVIGGRHVRITKDQIMCVVQ
jgi:hypothetical protein